MKKLVFALILPLTLLFAQTEEEKTIDLTGKFGLMFQIDENFNLNSFDGMSFAGKYFFNDDFGIRLLISTSYSETDQSAGKLTTYGDNQHSEGVIYNYDAVKYRIAPSIIYNLSNNESIRFYIGGGPLVSYSNDETANVTNYETDTYSRNRWVKDYSIGVNGFVGIEWFVKKNISLSAEYGLEYLYVESELWERKYENGQLTDEIDQKADKKLFQSLPVSLGVSIYF